MDYFSDTTSPSSSGLGSAVSEDAAQSNGVDVDTDAIESDTKKSQSSYKLTWKVEDGQLVRHWVEV
ncbi:hypothetical protein [[Limnothrix rosea] IAM M-220]|uniref:hypothetical protein n=1 Tax=[Limnothrix rosea] IAM M-220 TaxID=454133 RepID=UPI00095F2189|nr:hypothetical protein [[Limnothrix rosea] IAM M-220]OKH19960.1 hypothetical protein NIES208_00335 [[Limnothrix rosea] IAM M-220]